MQLKAYVAYGSSVTLILFLTDYQKLRLLLEYRSSKTREIGHRSSDFEVMFDYLISSRFASTEIIRTREQMRK